MSDSAATQSPAPAAKEKKTESKPKAHSTHPKNSFMVQAAIAITEERKCDPMLAIIIEYILDNYQVGKNEDIIDKYLKEALSGYLKESVVIQDYLLKLSRSSTSTTTRS